VISTERARSSGQPAIGKIVRKASCAMVEISPAILPALSEAPADLR
jgi:hypothetical protein